MTVSKSQGTFLRVSTASAAADTITGVTAASPPVVSSTGHGMANGTIVLIDGIVGMIELNGRAFVVSNSLTNSFELLGIDATSYTAYVSGGTATAQTTMSEVGQVIDMDGFDGEAPDIDITHLRSTADESLTGLQVFGGLRLNLFHDRTDAAHAKMRSLKALSSVGVFAITQTDGGVSAFTGLVKSFTWQAQANNVYRGTSSIKFRKEPSWFA